MFPLGAFFARNITLKMGQAPMPLADAQVGYQKFYGHEDGCVKVVLKP